MKLIEIPTDQLEHWLPVVWELLSEACNHSDGKYLPIDVAKALYEKRMQLWNAIEDNIVHAIGVTEIVNFPRKKVCRILAATGENYEVWGPLIAKIEEWAKNIGCETCEPVVRSSRVKLLKKLGYITTHAIMEKQL